jgi:hypothetical protein
MLLLAPNNTWAAVSDLRINEFNANADSGHADSTYTEEWVEIYNGGSTAEDLTGLVMDDFAGAGSSPRTIGTQVTVEGGDTIIPPGGFRVVVGFGNYYNNTGDDVRLLESDGTTVIDATSYASSTKGQTWARDADGTGSFAQGDHSKGASNVPGCGGGPACLAPQTCCAGICMTPACESNAECSPEDFCQDAGTCNAACVPRPPSPSAGVIKVMTFNVKEGGLDPAWKDVVKEENADIILLVETEDWDATKLSNLLDEFNIFFATDPPYHGDAEPNAPPFGGTAIMSRYPIIFAQQVASLTLDDSSTWTPTRDFMIWTLDVDGTTVVATGVHLKCCGGASNENRRERDMEGLINWFDANVPTGNIIIAGDYNAFSWADEQASNNLGDLGYGPLEMLLDENSGDAYDTFGSTQHFYFDAYREFVPVISAADHTYRIDPFDSRIDFIVINDGLIDMLGWPASVGGTVSAPGSDHWSVDVHIDFGPPQEVPAASGTTRGLIVLLVGLLGAAVIARSGRATG